MKTLSLVVESYPTLALFFLAGNDSFHMSSVLPFLEIINVEPNMDDQLDWVCNSNNDQLGILFLMTNKQSSPKDQSSEVLLTTMKVEAQSSGVFAKFFTIVSSKSTDVFINIIGDYGYKPKNSFSYTQKQKILDYLQTKVFTGHAQLAQNQKTKFTDYNQHFLNNIPQGVQSLKNTILKGRTNLQAAQQHLKRIQYERNCVVINYLNQQAYQFDRSKYHSMAWGFVFGALINLSAYKRGKAVRKAALFLAFGHFFGVASYVRNLDRYFDSVYPIFERDAVSFSKEQQQELQALSPQGKAFIEE